MKKSYFFKFFVFALVGALAILPSCKDYDDDISGLQNQIDQLASKTELTTQLGTLQSSLATAQTAATTAATKADQALTAANAAKAAADAAGDAALTEAAVKALAKAEADAAAAALKVEVLAELQAEIDALKAELEATNEAEFNAIQEELNKSLAEIAKNVEAATGLIAGAIFDVELISSYTGFAWEAGLLFSSATEKANVFSQGVSNAITFVKDNQVQTGTSLVIRVSPTNVIVTPEMISFQNSLGVAYDNLKVTKVEPYEELLTRSTNGGGLWKVYVELNNYDEDAFEAATQNKDGDDVLFAVALSNVEADAPSKVISAYDLGLYWEEYTPANGLDFTVNKKDVDEINNRFSNESISLGKRGDGTVYAEKEWKDGKTDVAIKTDPANTTTADDDRSALAMYPAVQGQPLKIEIADEDNKIRAMYVTLDFESNAIDSAPSEWNAWNGYSYTGLGTVVEGTTAEIIINNTSAINDIIGFRVFAVNYDGTLVDPDGKAFYVSLGKEATSWNALNTVVTASDVTDADVTNSASVNATLTKLTGATTYEWTTDKADNTAETTPAFDVVFADASGDLFGTNGAGAITADFSKVTKAYTVAKDASWLSYKDNKEYKGKLAIKNATGHVLATLDVTYKKVLPTAPEGFSVKTNQIAADGIYYSYLEPNDWAAPTATEGEMPLSQVFNFGAGTVASYETTFAASAGTDPLTDVVVTGGNVLSVDKSFVDNTTKHATKVVYNFGKISTETKNSAGAVIDYKVTVKEFQTVYSNIYNHTYSWRWATKADLKLAASATLPYSTSIEYGATESFDLAHIFGESTRDHKYDAFLNAPYLSSLQVVSAKLVSNANNLDEYFEVTPDPLAGATVFTLTEKSGSTNPTANVPSTLVLKAKDMYNNDVEIRLPMTVTKR